MFRHAIGSFGKVPFRIRSTSIKCVRRISQKARASDEDLEAEHAAARKWVAELNSDTIPVSLARISFARSSGAGGQHVNKTNSKATFTWPMDLILRYVPKIFHSELRRSRFYVASSDSLQMSVQTSRSQHANKSECHDKLHELLRDLGKKIIPGETPEIQKQKVVRLQQQEDAHRLYLKKKRSFKKQARSGSGRDY